jgi:hypothetical protein
VPLGITCGQLAGSSVQPTGVIIHGLLFEALQPGLYCFDKDQELFLLGLNMLHSLEHLWYDVPFLIGRSITILVFLGCARYGRFACYQMYSLLFPHF